MQLELYKTIDPANKLNKNLMGKITREIRLKQDDNILTPKIILKGGDELKDYNYGFIVSLSRYYFITGKRFLNNNHIEISLETDVLMTYKNDLLENEINITFTNDSSYFDGAINYDSRSELEILKSNIQTENSKTKILVTLGGKK